MGKARVSKASIIEALLKARGAVAVAAELLSITRNALYERIERDADLADVLRIASESTLDGVENKLAERALAGEPWAVCFYLKTKGACRGYQENSRHHITNEGPTPLVVIPAGTNPEDHGYVKAEGG